MIGAGIFCFCLIFYSSAYCNEVEDCNHDYCPESTEIVEHVGPRFEGDMLGFDNIHEVLNPIQRSGENTQDAALMDETKNPKLEVTALQIFKIQSCSDFLFRWPQGKVYYKISHHFTCKEKCMIHEAMQELETKTCLTFTQHDRQDDFIEILPSEFCASYIGRQGNRQRLFLTPYCALSIGTVIHEIMHALGFFHEQSRKDRDDYVDVNWDNILQYDRVNFVNHGLGNVTTYGLPYDYESLMHYEPYAFAKNEQIETIKPKHGQRIGLREKMSDLDVERINIHHNCTNRTIGCHDTRTNCEYTKNLKTSCRIQAFLTKCRRTCKSCSNHKLPNRVINEDSSCRTPADRCSAWTVNSDCARIVTDFRQVQRSNCYQKCQKCS